MKPAIRCSVEEAEFAALHKGRTLAAWWSQLCCLPGEHACEECSNSIAVYGHQRLNRARRHTLAAWQSGCPLFRELAAKLDVKLSEKLRQSLCQPAYVYSAGKSAQLMTDALYSTTAVEIVKCPGLVYSRRNMQQAAAWQAVSARLDCFHLYGCTGCNAKEVCLHLAG